GFARSRADDDYTIGVSDAERERRIDAVSDWGRGSILDAMAPTAGAVPGLRETWARYERSAASPGAVRSIMRMVYDIDLRDLLPAIRVPTLVLHRTDAARITIDNGRFLAAHIPDARLVEIPG